MRKILLTVISLFTLPAHVYAQSSVATGIKEVASTQIDTLKNLINIITEVLVKYSFQAIGGVIVLILGWMAAKYVTNILGKFLTKKEVDVTVSKFALAAVKLSIMAFATIVALGKFGIEIAPMIAGLSVAGFGLSFALQGPLSNYASGATLIFTKPFKVGDIIEVAGVMGEVLDMKLPSTELKTVDGNKIVIPNKHIIGEIIHNYSNAKLLDISVGVSYSTNIDKAIAVIHHAIKNEKRITKEAAIGITEFADSSVNLYARVLCKQDDYWDVKFKINKTIFDEFKKNGIEIPFPRRDVHIIEKKG